MIRAVLFDFDGVLVPLVETHDWAFREAVRRVCHPILAVPGGKIPAHYAGLSTREKLRLLTSEYGLPVPLHDAIWSAKQALTMQAIEETIRPDPDRMEIVSNLRRLDLRVACVSNSIRSTTDLALRRAALLPLMEFVISNEDAPAQKPDPAPYFEAFRRLELRPEECLAVEDSPHGKDSARRSGAHVLPVATYRDVAFRPIWNVIRTVDAGSVS